MENSSKRPDLNALINAELKNIRTQGNSFSAGFTPHAGFPPFGGHFPGNPILPGIALLAIVQTALEKAFSCALEPEEFRKIKFFRPVTPGTALILEGSADDAEGDDGGAPLIQADVSIRQKDDDTRVSTLRILYKKKELPR